MLFTIVLLHLVRHSSLETYDQVTQDCRNNPFERIICYTYRTTESDHLNSCFIIRGQVLEENAGTLDPPIFITIAVNHGLMARGKNQYLTFGLKNTLSAVHFTAQRRVNGTTMATVTLNELKTEDLMLLKADFHPAIDGNDTTLVFTLTVRRDQFQLGRTKYSFDSFSGMFISHSLGGRPMKTLLIPANHSTNIRHHSGFLYAGCEHKTSLCLSVTPTLVEERRCLDMALCPALVRIKRTHKNGLALYVNRQLSSASSGYISVGFSNTPVMDNTLVFDCIGHKNGVTETTLSYNEGHQNIDLKASLNISTEHRMSTSGLIECSWNLTYNKTYKAHNLTFNFSSGYYILRAIGRANSAVAANAIKKLQHNLTSVTENKVFITERGAFAHDFRSPNNTISSNISANVSQTVATLPHQDGVPIFTIEGSGFMATAALVVTSVGICSCILCCVCCCGPHLLKTLMHRSIRKITTKNMNKLTRRTAVLSPRARQSYESLTA